MMMQKNILKKLMLDLDGGSISLEESYLLQNSYVGGVILFSRNIISKEQTISLCREIREINPDLLIAIDQEGGRVQRLKVGHTILPSMRELATYCAHDNYANIGFARELGWLLASEIIASGLDISFAPVLDLDFNTSSIIGDRSFGDIPERVGDLANQFISGMNEAGMQAIGKHFPGHGGIYEDTHLVHAEDNRSLEAIIKHDLVPFSLLKDKLGGIMTAHITFPKIHHEIATYSKFWLSELLRDQLKFTGIIFSDDLSMKGAGQKEDISIKVHKAFEAGCDIILICNDRLSVLEALNFMSNNYDVSTSNLHDLKATKNISWDSLEQDPRRVNTVNTIQTISHTAK